MRRIVILTLVAVVVFAMFPAAASAHHRATRYCSSTGDICQSTTKVHGVRMLKVRLAAEFFTRYRLCVTAPDDVRTCKTFRVHEVAGGVFASSVRWANQFPDGGPGAYDVGWRSLPGSSRVGHILGFHVTA